MRLLHQVQVGDQLHGELTHGVIQTIYFYHQVKAMAMTLGTLDAVFPSSGWGGESWSEGTWGSVGTGNQLVTGFAMSMSTGQLEQTSSTGWGRSTWGSDIWNGFGTTLPSGLAATMAIDGNVLINTEINAGWGRLGWNVNAWGVRGQVGATGQAMTMTLSNVSILNEINTGWGSDGWGVEGWGSSIQVVQPSGQVITVAEGSAGLSFDGDSNLTFKWKCINCSIR